MQPRSSGILLHITSLPSRYGIGDLGPDACRFADFLAKSGQNVWQILPLNPTDPAYGSSPYYCTSAFAGNPLLISPDLLFKEGRLNRSELSDISRPGGDQADYRRAADLKKHMFHLAWQRFQNRKGKTDYERFCRYHRSWLDDYTMFTTLSACFPGKAWCDWPKSLRERHPRALAEVKKRFSKTMEFLKFLQYLFYGQWIRLKHCCNQKGIRMLGDIPIYLPYDSADVWAHSNLFKLNRHRKPYVVSGVPPDYFSRTGQLWGHPIYDWRLLKQLGYDWWIRRIAHNLKMYDQVRIDHFRGFVAYWEVPAASKTAQTGKWVHAPADDFFNRLLRRFPCLPVIAEDLGTITPDVRDIMHRFDFPGMKILQFAFGEDFPTSAYLPHNVPKHSVMYTGTHDNDTIRGWYEDPANTEERRHLHRYLGRKIPSDRIHLEMIRTVMMSPANLTVIAMQDVLGLDSSARMNHPARHTGNWKWRLQKNQITDRIADTLLEMATVYERT